VARIAVHKQKGAEGPGKQNRQAFDREQSPGLHALTIPLARRLATPALRVGQCSSRVPTFSKHWSTGAIRFARIQVVGRSRSPFAPAYRLGGTIQPISVTAERPDFDGGEELDAVARASAERIEKTCFDQNGDVVGLKPQYLGCLLSVQPGGEPEHVQAGRGIGS